jgi:K+-transporting ATPase ATPase C chain
MRKDLVTSVIAVVFLTALLGVAYPLVITGVSQLAFPGRADGSLVHRDGKVVGSRLIARPALDARRRPDPRLFQPRPSQSGYSASATFFSNRGPNDAGAVRFYRGALRTYLRLERPYTPGLTARRVPIDAVTTSASGVDPHISPANARIQANRIARVRHLPLDRVRRLVDDHTDGRALGVLGEPGVNVTELNLALDGTR